MDMDLSRKFEANQWVGEQTILWWATKLNVKQVYSALQVACMHGIYKYYVK